MPRARRGMAGEMDSDGGRCNIPLALIGRTMRQLALTTAQQRRLERLARESRRRPKAMLQFVLRDGFEACEEDVRENLAADAEFASGKSFTHKEAIRQARSAIPFGLVGVPMQAMFHNAAFIAAGVPVFDIHEKFGATDLLVRDSPKGVALAQVMGDKDVVLMRAHGSVACGPTLQSAVFRA